MAWKTIARSSIGRTHIKKSLPCQDFAEIREVSKGLIIGACSDGAGSAKKSEVGAQQAVDAALRSMTRHGFALFKSEEEARKTFLSVLAEVKENLAAAAEIHDVDVKQLNCTLLCFVATPRRLVAAQIGDGFLVFRRKPKAATEEFALAAQYELLFEPDRGEFANQTVFVTSSRAENALQVGLVKGDIDFVAAGSDGLLPVAVRYKDWSAHAPFFAPFYTFLKDDPPQAEMESEIDAFLASDRLNKKTDDDKTLMLCYYSCGKEKEESSKKEQ